MKHFILVCGLFLAASVVASSRAADDPKEKKEGKERSLADISMEVDALRAFYSLHLTDEQLKSVAKLAKETGDPDRKRTKAKASDEYRRALTDLRDALVDASDDDKIGDLEDEVDQLSEKEKPEVDNGFDVTKAARKRTRDVMNLLKPDQLATYYGSVSDDVQDPAAELTKALEDVRGLAMKEWREKRDEIADNIGWAVAGVDLAQSEKVSKKVEALLSRVRSMGADDFKKKSADLEKEAKALVGEVPSDKLLRNHAERTVAEMLSNPRLDVAIRARQK